MNMPGLFVLSLCSSGLLSAELAIGDVARDLSFTDSQFRVRKLEGFEDADAIVIVFLDSACVAATEEIPYLQDLWSKYGHQGVQMLALYSGPNDSLVEAAAQLLEGGATFSLGMDFDQSIKTALGARRTPEVALLDSDRKLRYRGTIRNGSTLIAENALDAILRGRKVLNTEQPSQGCLIRRPRKLRGRGVDYEKHIAPILRMRCLSCHRDRGSAPFSLESYEDAVQRHAKIALVVSQRQMPPSLADPAIGPFAKSRRLTRKELELIKNWSFGGAPRGDAKRVEADAGTASSQGSVVWKGTRLDSFGVVPSTARWEVSSTRMKEDTWIQAIEWLPGDPKHSRAVHLDLEDSAGNRRGLLSLGREDGRVSWPAGTALLIPRGERLLSAIEVTKSLKTELAPSRLKLEFSSESVQRRVRSAQISCDGPGVKAIVARDGLKQAVTLHRIMPTIFDGLRALTVTATRLPQPDETRSKEPLLHVPLFDARWTFGYTWPEGKEIAAGTSLEFDFIQIRSESTYYAQAVLYYSRRDENLNLRIDPATGHVRAE